MYVTFGQDHLHRVNGKRFDKDSVAVIECENEVHGATLMAVFFGKLYSCFYPDPLFDLECVPKYYPRGLIEVN